MTFVRLQLCVALIVAAWLVLPSTGHAQATLIDGLGGTADYGSECLGMNDDGSSNAIDLTPYFPSGLRFFDRTHGSVHINTNGNISFSEPVPAYTAMPFPVADQPMIAPYWADVDIRTFRRMRGFMRDCNGPPNGDTTIGPACHDPSENGVWWHLEPGRLIVTWDRVSFFECHSDNDQRMSFQLIITEVESSACGATGDFDVEFRYNRCEWTTGDASDPTPDRDGFGGTQAQAGFDAGNEMDFVMIPGSRTDRIHEILCQESNVGDVSEDPSLAGIWRFEIRSGEVLCPGAGEPCETGMVGVCATGRTQCIADRIECRPELSSSDEVCDSLDNDCDGMVDEGEAICDRFEICREGSCIGNCFEGGCPDGLTCTEDGLCVEDACVGVSCSEGERCEGGACVSPCDGIVCPHGSSCVAGQCVDLCADATCDECSLCVDGACVARCQQAGCEAGEGCRFDGRCVEEACVSVTCEAGTHCEGGSCVDSCEGVTCPGEDVCTAGECGPAPPVVDAGVPTSDAGAVATPDGGTPPVMEDGGTSMGGADGGSEPDGSDDGCGCRAVGSRSSGAGSTGRGSGLLALLALGLATLSRRRRGR